jgi:FAD-dependent urate hydroxylase
VERIVAAGARMSSGKTPGPVGRLLRDVMLKIVLRFVVTEKSLRWLTDYRIDWDGNAERAVGASPRVEPASV